MAMDINKSILHIPLNGSIKDAALAYAKFGLKVVPLCPPDHKGVSMNHAEKCKNPGKVPLIQDWKDCASTDPTIVENWFVDWPNANVGMLLGSTAGYVAIDVDGEYGWKRLEEISGGNIPPTWEFVTPGGGYRYIFKAPSDKKFPSRNFALPGSKHQELAFLGDGRLTVLPPSRHRNGGVYRWL